jgi:O-antigen ligase
MNLVLFLFIASVFSLGLGEFGQFPFGQTQFSVSLTDILVALTAIFIVIWKIGIKKDLSMNKIFYWLAGFWVIGFLSLLLNGNFSGGFYLLRFIMYSGIFYVVFHLAKSKILGFGELSDIFKFVSLLIAGLGFLQLIFFPDLEVLSVYGYDPHKFRLFSTFLDPNFAGTFISFGLILSLGTMLHTKFELFGNFLKLRKPEIVVFITLFTALILTFSRSAYLMFFSAAFILFAFKKKLLLIPLFLVPLILYLIFPPFSQRIEGLINLDRSASERIYSWDKGLALFRLNPVVGIGFNNIRDVSQKNNLIKTFSVDGGNSGSGIDSSLLFVLATTGIAGLIALGGFLGKTLFKMLGDIQKNKKTLPITLIAVFAGLILNSLFINSLFFPAVMVIWFSLLGLYYGLGEGDGDAS